MELPSCFVLSTDVSGPIKTPGLDADARGAFPKPHKYLFVAKLKVPKTFINDGRGAGLEYDMGELEAEVPPEEGAFDFEGEPIEGGAQSSASSSGAVLPQEQVELNDGEDVEDDHEEERSDKRLSPEEDLDLSGPEVVNLIFATALQDNKSAIVLEAIQDVVTYCWALNIPVVRFHCDRGVLHQGYKAAD